MKHNFKRFLSLVVAMVMVFGMLPMNVFATEGEPAAYVAEVNGVQYATLKEAVEAANKLGTATVIMLDNVTLGEKLTISGDVTIEGEYTITRADDYTGTLFTVNKGAELTLDGGLVIDGNNYWTLDQDTYNTNLKNGVKGTKRADILTSESDAPKTTAAMFVVNGTVNANQVTIQNSYSDKDSNGGDSAIFKVTADGAALNMTGAIFKHIATGGANAIAYLSSNAVWTINEGTLIDDIFAGRNGGVGRIDGKASVVMTGGTISNSRGINDNGTVFMFCNTSTFKLNGGTICSNSGLCGSNNGRLAPIYLHDSSSMTMTGGSICHNTGYWVSGGIDIATENAKLSISGGNVFYNETISDEYNYDDVAPGDHSVFTGGRYSQNITGWTAAPYEVIAHEGVGENGKTLYQVAPVITVTFASFAITEGEALPEFTYTVSDPIEGDVVNVTVETPVVEVNGSGEYEITAKATASDEKYYVRVVPGKLTVKDTGILTVDGVWFDSFDEAKSAIKKDSAIVLYGDVESNYGVGCDKDYHFPGNGNITLELNGHEFRSVKSSVKGTTTTITIGANTTLTVTDSVGTGSIVIETKGHPLCLSNNSTLILPETINFEGTIQLYYVNGQVYLGKELMLGEGAPIQTNEWIDAKGVLRKYNNVYFDANGDIILGGGSFTLNEDFTWAADRNITIPASVTVDLNGNDLTAKNITVQGKLIDTADGVGVVTTDKLWFNGHNNGGYLPLADGEVYRLFATELVNKGGREQTATYVKFGFTVRLNKAEAYELLEKAAQDGMLTANASWTVAGETEEKSFEYSGGALRNHAAAAFAQLTAGKAVTSTMILNIHGETALASGDQVTGYAELSTDTGVVIGSATVTYTKN